MDFTIVTPSFNYGHFIDDCLASVAGQEGVELEHLIMDAGSDDGTAESVRRYPHASLHQEPDQGMSDGINKGFRRAKGEWLMWLNADDRLKPGALAEVKRFAAEHPDSDVIYGCWNFIDEAGEFLRRMTVFPYRKRMMANHMTYFASTSTFFRRLTTTGEGYLLNEKFGCVMDGEFFCRLAVAKKRFEYFPCVLADFRLHDQSISQKFLDCTDINGLLAREMQLAERRAIHRKYGMTFFRDEMLNRIVEGLLFHLFRFQKAVLRWRHHRSCREANR